MRTTRTILIALALAAFGAACDNADTPIDCDDPDNEDICENLIYAPEPPGIFDEAPVVHQDEPASAE